MCLGKRLSEEGREEQKAGDGLAVEEPPEKLIT